MRKLEGLVGVTVDGSELETAAADYERQVSLAVQSDPDVQAFVERLEKAAEEEDEPVDPSAAALGRLDRPRVPALPAPARARREVAVATGGTAAYTGGGESMQISTSRSLSDALRNMCERSLR